MALSKRELEELVQRATQRMVSNVCWAMESDDPDFLSYMEALAQLEAQRPGLVNRAEVQRTLKKSFGIIRSNEAVQRHFRGTCNCGR